MARTRLFVALLPEPDTWATLDTLRRSLGVDEPFRIPPHVTLVPPVNVAADQLDEVDRVMTAAVASVEPFDLELGAATTFLPGAPTLQLSVHGDLPALGRLRDALVSGPLDRPGRRPFVPHVTLVPNAEPDLIEAGLRALAGTGVRWPVRAVHVLERRHDPGRWATVAELPLGAPAVVARGGPASFIRVLHMVPGTVAELCRVAARGPAEDASSDLPLVVAAEAEPGDGTGGLQAAAVGFLGIGGAELRSLVVADEWRGLGVGSRVLAAWISAAADRGARLVTAPTDDEAGFLARHGFSLLGRANAARLVRLL